MSVHGIPLQTQVGTTHNHIASNSNSMSVNGIGGSSNSIKKVIGVRSNSPPEITGSLQIDPHSHNHNHSGKGGQIQMRKKSGKKEIVVLTPETVHSANSAASFGIIDEREPVDMKLK